MTYRERQRLSDIQAAIDAIRSHLRRGDLSDDLVFVAVRIRLVEIYASPPSAVCRSMAGMTDVQYGRGGT